MLCFVLLSPPWLSLSQDDNMQNKVKTRAGCRIRVFLQLREFLFRLSWLFTFQINRCFYRLTLVHEDGSWSHSYNMIPN